MEEAEKKRRMQALCECLKAASEAYYRDSTEMMPNIEYDALYDELLALEAETGIVLSGSPTQKVGYEALSFLPKEAHDHPMLSLDKTKDVTVLKEWIGRQKALLSWKLDGLTVVLHYENGALLKAVTRGNGHMGEVVTNNARAFQNIPLTVPYRGRLILRGEAVIRYSDFYRMNDEMEDAGAKYKNPRNLCSGSVRQLDPNVTRERKVFFCAFSLVEADGIDFRNSHEEEFSWLSSMGFDVVEFVSVTESNLEEAVETFEKKVAGNDFPSDGLVLLLDDIAYGNALGTTAKFPRNAIAFKWSDEMRETTLHEIEWSPSRTGLINPVAIFAPVELEGTTVSRASVHNISVLKQLSLGIGDHIAVYKANMIIPQIAENLTKSGNFEIPAHCPVCGGKTAIHRENGIETLHCENPECAVKKIKKFALLTSRDALNVEGLSEQTLEKLMSAGLIHEYADLFSLESHREVIEKLEGFGKKSAEKLIKSAEKSRDTDMTRLIYALGIPGIGLQNAKLLTRYFNEDMERFQNASETDFCEVDGVGAVLAASIRRFLDAEENKREIMHLLSVLHLQKTSVSDGAQDTRYAGNTFVVTGSVEHFKNRAELKKYIEARGGKTSESVSKKTAYLINNDKNSASGKNKKARELGIPVISEEEFLAL